VRGRGAFPPSSSFFFSPLSRSPLPSLLFLGASLDLIGSAHLHESTLNAALTFLLRLLCLQPTPSSTTSSPTSPQQSSPPTSLTTADLAATSSKFPTARPLQLRPTLAGNARPQEERSVHAPPLAAARSSAPASRRPNGPQAHAARVWRLDTGRGPPRPAAPAPSSALAPAEPSKERRDKILHDRKKGLYVRRPRSPSPDRARARASQHLEVSKPVKESQVRRPSFLSSAKTDSS